MTKRRISVVPPSDRTNPLYFSPADAPWGGYINIRMSDDFKQHFYDWMADHANDIMPSMIDMQATGLKFTMSFDHENDCFIVSVTGALLQPSLDRYCVTSRAGTMTDALGLAVWKHCVLAMGNYGDYLPKTGDFKRFG